MFNHWQRQLEEFWPYYVTQHQHPLNRQLHFIGNTNLLFWIGVAFVRRNPVWLIWAVASSYALAWVGHFGFERNIPATFRYPLLAGVCDLIMYYKMWRGEMEAEVARYVTQEA